MPDLTVPFPWTQGMRPDPPGAPAREMSWEEVLWRRLTGRLGGLKTGDTTRESELILGIGRNVYYYVGACHPDFGLFVAAYGQHSSSAQATTAISPFDTGGIAQGHTPLNSPISSDVLVQRETYGVGTYQSRFDDWVNAAYTERTEYPALHRPAFVTSPEIDLDAANGDGRAWMWEGRVAASDLATAPLEPIAIFFLPGRRIRYRD